MMDTARLNALNRATYAGVIQRTEYNGGFVYMDFWGGIWTEEEMEEAVKLGKIEQLPVYRRVME